MFGSDGDNPNPPRSIEERYESATGASHLRIEAHRSGPGDVIAAAGMNPYQTGMALMRLRSEWDKSAKPKPPTRAAIEALAGSYKVEPAERKGIPNPNAGLVEREIKPGRFAYRKPMEVAEEEASGWYLHELSLLFRSMKTLPEVREELERWIGPPHAAHIVGSVLAWWLEPRCLTCQGCGKRIVKNTGGRSSGKPCLACVMNPGHRPLPHAGIGRKLLAHINACCGTAKAELIESMKPRRGAANLAQREQAKKDAKIAKLRRADEEAKAEAEADNAEVAARFGAAMGKKRLRAAGVKR